jgi:predicted O-methyltransferase YrrM
MMASKSDNFAAVDDYLGELFAPTDSVFAQVLKNCDDAELPAISVTANQGKLLYLLAKIQRAQSILELGTLGGYSTIWLARALPDDGKLVTLEAEATHAEVAQTNLKIAHVDTLVDLRLGLALDTLPKLEQEGAGPFDLIFLDADKPNNPHYFQWAMKLARTGSVIIADNVVRQGEVVNANSSDESVIGVRQLNEMMAAESHFEVTAIQTVGSKGHDGFAIGIVK